MAITLFPPYFTLLLGALAALAAGTLAGCADRDSEEREVGYAAACSSALQCFLPCRGYEECTECLESRGSETVGLVAAYDSIQCGYDRCPIVCGPEAVLNDCLTCMEHECPDPIAACEGWGSREYDAGNGEPLLTCFELRACLGACSSDGELCGQDCYWEARPQARLAFWKLWALVHGSCADRCREAPSQTCESCIGDHANVRGIADCLDG